jgi:ABC-type proline/glycine betaine transport system substrate-binding protein
LGRWEGSQRRLLGASLTLIGTVGGFAPSPGLGATPADPAAPVESAACRTVRFADVGWTDVTATTALASEVLRR